MKFAALVLLAALSAFAAPRKQPVTPVPVRPAPVAECAGEIGTPIYQCFHKEAGVDIRLYVQEFQTCANGKVTQFDRSVSGLYNADSAQANDVIDIQEPNVTVQYEATRTQLPYSVNTTFILPTSASLTTPDGRFDMTMTKNLAPDFDGAPEDQSHYVGAYTHFDVSGHVVEAGELSCIVVE